MKREAEIVDDIIAKMEMYRNRNKRRNPSIKKYFSADNVIYLLEKVKERIIEENDNEI